MLGWLLVGAGALLLVACALLYNRLVKLRNRVDNAWSQVDVQLRRRYDRFAFSDLENGFSGAFTPPSSSSSGGGDNFSGGGGGGAW